MANINVTQVNGASGEVSPRMYARTDTLPGRNSAQIVDNFIVELQGNRKYRTGFVHSHITKNNKRSVLIPFQFSNQQAYMLEFSEDYKMRIYKDGSIVLETAKTITGASQANPCVITITSHGFSTGDEIFISGVAGMSELNGRYYKVTYISANTFSITDLYNANINSTAFTAYSSGGSAYRVVEIAHPYSIEHLPELKYSQNADYMFIDHRQYEPRILVRSSHSSWSLAAYVRGAATDPFSKTISAITKANPAVVTTSVAHGFATGDLIPFDSVGGMTELNRNYYKITVLSTTTFSLQDPVTGSNINSSGYGAFTSGGTCGYFPQATWFYNGRLFHGGGLTKSERIVGSRLPDTNGAARYADFTIGTADTDAVYFTLTPSHNIIDFIVWIAGNSKYLLVGTYGGVGKVTGDNENNNITPSSISHKPLESIGCSDIMPIASGNIVVYVDRTSLVVASYEYDVMYDSYMPVNRTKLADHITASGIKKLVLQRGMQDTVWALRNDGVLLGMVFDSKENVAGWFKLKTSGTIYDIGINPRDNEYDRLWAVLEREVSGTTRRELCYLADDIAYETVENFYTGPNNYEADIEKFRRQTYENHKQGIFLDNCLSFDGSDRGVSAGANLSLGTGYNAIGSTVVVTASASVFTAEDLGNEIRFKSLTGGETGRGTIIVYSSGTQVSIIIEEVFSSNSVLSGNWYLTAKTISGLYTLNGEYVTVVVDGGLYKSIESVLVVNNEVTLTVQGSVVHIGHAYTGLIKSQNIDGAGIGVNISTVPKKANKVSCRFYNTLGVKVGTSLYNTEEVLYLSSSEYYDRPPALFTGIKEINVPDSVTNEKFIYILQEYPAPCVVQILDVYLEVNNE